MKYDDFLEKETPGEGGCMLCEGINEKSKTEFFLVQRRHASNGDIFVVNSYFHYDYAFLWNEENPWKILYKKEAK